MLTTSFLFSIKSGGIFDSSDDRERERESKDIKMQEIWTFRNWECIVIDLVRLNELQESEYRRRDSRTHCPCDLDTQRDGSNSVSTLGRSSILFRFSTDSTLCPIKKSSNLQNGNLLYFLYVILLLESCFVFYHLFILSFIILVCFTNSWQNFKWCLVNLCGCRPLVIITLKKSMMQLATFFFRPLQAEFVIVERVVGRWIGRERQRQRRMGVCEVEGGYVRRYEERFEELLWRKLTKSINTLYS